MEAEQHAVRGLLSWGGGALWQTEVWWGWGRDRDTQQSRYDRTFDLQFLTWDFS